MSKEETKYPHTFAIDVRPMFLQESSWTYFRTCNNEAELDEVLKEYEDMGYVIDEVWTEKYWKNER